MELKDSSLLRSLCFIDGNWVQADNGETLSVLNKFSGAEICKVPNCGKNETERAIDAAQKVFKGWAAMTAKARGVILHKWNDLIHAHLDDLALILTLEQGKPLAEAKAEILLGSTYRLVCRRRSQSLWRNYPLSLDWKTASGYSAAHWSLSSYHSMEFSKFHDYQKSGSCPGCWLPGYS